MAEPNPNEFQRDLEEFLAGEAAPRPDSAVREVIDRERRAAESLAILDIPNPPSWVTGERIGHMERHGFELRYLPIGADRDPHRKGEVAEVMTTTTADPGWYVVRDAPLPASELAYRPSAGDTLRIPPESVVDFHQAVADLPEHTPLTWDVRMPTLPELFYLLRQSAYYIPDAEILCNNGPKLNQAVSLIKEGEELYHRIYGVTEPFDGSVLPIQRLG